MRTKIWAVGGTCAVIVAIGVAAAMAGKTTAAQASRQQVPLFEPDPLWSQALPNKWVTGQVGGVAVDSHDNVWVFHRPDTIPDGEKGASLNPPQSECCIPAAVLPWNLSARTLVVRGAGDRVANGPPTNTRSSSTPRTTSG